MAKMPAFMFYPGDWMKDPALRACSLAARGLWIDALSLMFESSRRGYLQHATGKPVTAEQLARMTGCSTDEVSRLLQELEDAGVFSRTESGAIFSRRMDRDERKRAKCQEAGKRGGNPALKGTVKGKSKGEVKGRSNRKPTPSSSVSFSPSGNPPSEGPPGAVGQGSHQDFIRIFVSAWEGHHAGQKYPFSGGKDGDAVKWFVDQLRGDIGKFESIVGRFLSEDSDFYRGHPMGKLRSDFARFIVDAPPKSRSNSFQTHDDRVADVFFGGSANG